MKSSTSESKLFQSRSKGGIPGRARREKRLSLSILKWAFLIDSDVKLFIKIQCIRFCSWKGRRLNRILAWTIGVVVITEKQRLTVSSLHSFNVQRVSFTHHGLIPSFTDGRTDWLTQTMRLTWWFCCWQVALQRYLRKTFTSMKLAMMKRRDNSENWKD